MGAPGAGIGWAGSQEGKGGFAASTIATPAAGRAGSLDAGPRAPPSAASRKSESRDPGKGRKRLKFGVIGNRGNCNANGGAAVSSCEQLAAFVRPFNDPITRLLNYPIFSGYPSPFTSRTTAVDPALRSLAISW